MNDIAQFSRANSIPPLFEHQAQTKEFGLTHPVVFDMSDAGTGKTRAWLEVLQQRKKLMGGKALVLAPRTILQNAWADDIRKYVPDMTYSIAYASNRKKAFDAEADIYITNHDAVKWLAKNIQVLRDRGFHSVIMDESTAYKHRTSQRSKAMAKIAALFQFRTNLSATPNSNGITDIWHQVMLLDDGAHLGNNFWKFQSTACEARQVGPSPQHRKWVDRPGAAEAVADLIDDICIRHVFEECTDIPPNHEYPVAFELSPAHRRAYNVLKEHALLELENGEVSAFNSQVITNKLLQMASGAVYDADQVTRLYATERYELVMDLAEQREQSVIAFNWTHQRDQLIALAEKRGIPYAVIDGKASDKQRLEAVRNYQMGLLRVIFAHPASAAHGLTLTKGTATIWASPVYNAEYFWQFNRRIYRISQTKKTETIIVIARDTVDEKVADSLMGKVDGMVSLLEMVS